MSSFATCGCAWSPRTDPQKDALAPGQNHRNLRTRLHLGDGRRGIVISGLVQMLYPVCKDEDANE